MGANNPPVQDGDIDYERLAAFPAAARCLVCQRQRETVYAHEATPRL